MDIISLGAATKAAMEEAKTRKQTLEVGVKGTHDNVAKRLEALESAYGNSVKKANELIVKDAVNIMKAHARLNMIAQSKKYKMENMIFDDLLTPDGLNVPALKNVYHDQTLGELSSSNGGAYEFETVEEQTIAPVRSVLLQVERTQEMEMESGIVSRGKPVRSVSGPVSSLSLITDGIKNNINSGSYAYSNGSGEVEVDLLEVHKLDWINVYHYYGDGRKYNDVRFSISEDGVTWIKVFDSAVDGAYESTSEGKKVILDGIKARYIRSFANGSTMNAATHWIEIEAFGVSTVPSVNRALGKQINSISGNVSNLVYVTDGRLDNVSGTTGWATSSGPGEIEIDLEALLSIHQIKLFHYWDDARTYHDVRVKVSADKVNWTTVFDTKVSGEYKETPLGKTVDLTGERVRYIRCYANGSTTNNATHWSEVMAIQKLGEGSDDVYEISVNKGKSWRRIIPDKLFEVDEKDSLQENGFSVRAKLDGISKIKSYGLTWT